MSHYSAQNCNTLHTLHYTNYTTPQLQLQLHDTNYTTSQLQPRYTTLHYNILQLQLQLHYTTPHPAVVVRWPLQPLQPLQNATPTTFRSISGQWMSSAIHDSQQLTSPIGFLFLKLPPPPCAVLLVILELSDCNATLKHSYTINQMIR